MTEAAAPIPAARAEPAETARAGHATADRHGGIGGRSGDA